MAYQFIHIEDYGINISKKRSNNGTSEKYKKETKGRSVSQIISEAKRDNGFCSHVEKPEDPIILYGKSLDEVEKLAMEYHSKTKIIDKNGKEKKLRSDANVLLAGVISLNRENMEIWEDYKNDSIAYLKNKYGKKLISVIEHTDEEHPHIHFYCIQDIGKKFDLIHDGKKALYENKDKKKHDQNIAYLDSMRAFQEDFFKVVSSNYGLSKDGPKRARMSRSDYFKLGREVKLINQVKVKAKKDAYKFAIDEFRNENWFNKITTSFDFNRKSLEEATKRGDKYKKSLGSKNKKIKDLEGIETKYNDLRKDFKVRVNNQTELLRNKNSDLENENKKIKQENTDLISENQNLKTTLEESFPLYELLKNKYGDRFEEWKDNLFNTVKSKLKFK
ncbi:hypothetical protein DRT20_24080 [Salmonella enterica subsp. enterica serovar Virchow]|nr:hypothetical protein [Salmonella enterica subsp. enterica serovar Java]EBX3120285.1 hypothetical protein [Salmonella enterica subsp. enterica serovar Virchow]